MRLKLINENGNIFIEYNNKKMFLFEQDKLKGLNIDKFNKDISFITDVLLQSRYFDSLYKNLKTLKLNFDLLQEDILVIKLLDKSTNGLDIDDIICNYEKFTDVGYYYIFNDYVNYKSVVINVVLYK